MADEMDCNCAFSGPLGNRREFVTGLAHELALRMARNRKMLSADGLVAYVSAVADELERCGEADWMADEDEQGRVMTEALDRDIDDLEREIE
jgi:hypothetical protein